MDISEIRRANLRKLAKLAGGRPELAEKLEMAYAQLTHLIGKTPTRNIGPNVARRAEEVFGLTHGWLDIIHTDLEDSKSSKSQSNSLNKLVSDLQELNAQQLLSEEAIQILQSTVTLLSKNRKQPQIDTDEVERVNRLFDDAE